MYTLTHVPHAYPRPLLSLIHTPTHAHTYRITSKHMKCSWSPSYHILIPGHRIEEEVRKGICQPPFGLLSRQIHNMKSWELCHEGRGVKRRWEPAFSAAVLPLAQCVLGELSNERTQPLQDPLSLSVTQLHRQLLRAAHLVCPSSVACGISCAWQGEEAPPGLTDSCLVKNLR